MLPTAQQPPRLLSARWTLTVTGVFVPSPRLFHHPLLFLIPGTLIYGGYLNICLLLGVDRGDTSTWTSPKPPVSCWSWRECSPAWGGGGGCTRSSRWSL